ncbi:MAG: 4-hydroxy-tetrahydrodipicolinate synthase [Saprospiraceae bacterium]|nr:4-hydroxy-tetrahydrodipicolinate synthase [Saprospiraceae bacterium]
MEEIKGLGTALVTPFRDGQVDYKALERLIAYQIEGGVDYLVSMGTTGESVTLSAEEIDKIVRFTVEQVDDKIPIVVGMGGNNTSVLRKKMKEFNFDGISAILSSSPAYNKPSQEGIYAHYSALAEIAPRPIIIYNVPGRTGSNVSAATTLRLAHDHHNIVGIKEASADMIQGAEIIRNKPEDFVVISGDDPTALTLIALGGEGCISVIANAWPREFHQVIDSGRQGDLKTARKGHLRLLPIHEWLYVDGNPCGIKSALEIKGLCSNEVRLPLVPMSEANYKILEKVITDVETGVA